MSLPLLILLQVYQNGVCDANICSMFILPDSKHPREVLPLNTPYDLAPRGIMVMNLHRLFGQPILLLMLG